MQEQDESLREQIVNEYRYDLTRLLRYLPYFDKKTGKDVQSYYEGGERKLESVKVPVYDSTLLAFVKDAKTTKFMYRNYHYVYRRLRIESPAQERKILENAAIRDIDVFRAILSKYVLEGQTKSVMWTRGVEERIYVTVLDTLQKRFAEYDKLLVNKGLRH